MSLLLPPGGGRSQIQYIRISSSYGQGLHMEWEVFIGRSTYLDLGGKNLTTTWWW